MQRDGRRVVTPDGYVWYLRRRRARRRPPWARPRPARFHGEEELPAEEVPVPPWVDLWRFPNVEVGERPFDRFNDDRHAASNAAWAVLIGFAACSVLAALTVAYVLPWLLPWLAANARLLLGSPPPWPWRWDSTRSTGPGTWSCSARGWPTPRGGSGVCADGGGAAA